MCARCGQTASSRYRLNQIPCEPTIFSSGKKNFNEYEGNSEKKHNFEHVWMALSGGGTKCHACGTWDDDWSANKPCPAKLKHLKSDDDYVKYYGPKYNSPPPPEYPLLHAFSGRKCVHCYGEVGKLDLTKPCGVRNTENKADSDKALAYLSMPLAHAWEPKESTQYCKYCDVQVSTELMYLECPGKAKALLLAAQERLTAMIALTNGLSASPIWHDVSGDHPSAEVMGMLVDEADKSRIVLEAFQELFEAPEPEKSDDKYKVVNISLEDVAESEESEIDFGLSSVVEKKQVATQKMFTLCGTTVEHDSLMKQAKQEGWYSEQIRSKAIPLHVKGLLLWRALPPLKTVLSSCFTAHGRVCPTRSRRTCSCEPHSIRCPS